MTEWQTVSTGSPYEPIVGISRAVRTGNIIAVAGTAPLGPDGKTVGVGDPAAQARRCFEISRLALEQLGAGLKDVIRTRILLTRIEDWRVVADVHGALFRDIIRREIAVEHQLPKMSALRTWLTPDRPGAAPTHFGRS